MLSEEAEPQRFEYLLTNSCFFFFSPFNPPWHSIPFTDHTRLIWPKFDLYHYFNNRYPFPSPKHLPYQINLKIRSAWKFYLLIFIQKATTCAFTLLYGETPFTRKAKGDCVFNKHVPPGLGITPLPINYQKCKLYIIIPFRIKWFINIRKKVGRWAHLIYKIENKLPPTHRCFLFKFPTFMRNICLMHLKSNQLPLFPLSKHP